MNRSLAPEIKSPTEYQLKLQPYELFSLDNGIPVYMVNAGTQEVLQIEFVFYAGNSHESNKGIAAATNFLLKNGTLSKTALQINEGFEYYGAYCNRSCYNETAVLSLHTINKHVDKLLPLLSEMLTESTFPEAELEIYKTNAKQRLAVNLKKCEFVAGRLIDVYLYGQEHPYGKYSESSDYDNLDASALREFYKKNYVNGRLAIFVSGLIPSGLKQMLNTHFAKMSCTAPDFTNQYIPTAPAIEKKFRIQNDPTAVQGAIRIASPFPNRHHPDFKKVMVLNTLFGGFFGSRLMANIREDKGYTYGIYSYLQNHIQESSWMISTEAGKDVCEKAIEEIYQEMKLLRDEKVDQEELDLVRNYMIGSILGDLDGPFHIMAKWKNIILNGLDQKYFHESVEVIKTISATELQELANKYLRPDRFYELVVY
jgi:predicted Zn-dependent peptidase